MIISFTTLLLVLIPVSYVLVSSLTQAAGARTRTTALSVAEQWIETLNTQGPPNGSQGLPKVGIPISEGTQREAGVTYGVSALFNWATVNGTLDLCRSGVIPQVLNLTVTVSWNGGHSLNDSTIIDYPPASVPVDGFIGVQIEGDPSGATNPEPVDASGRTWGGPNGRVTDVLVTATPSGGGTAYTAYADNTGCAFMETPPGNYTVQVGPATATTAFVPPGSSSSTLTTTTTVITNQVSTPGPFLYDEGAYINLAYPDSSAVEGGVSCPGTATFQCLVTGQSPSGAASDGSTGVVAAASVFSGTRWSSVALPASAGVSRIESVACGDLCVGVGYGPGGRGAAVVDDPHQTSSWAASPLPAGVGELRQVRCPQADTCLALGTGAAGPVILGGHLSGGGVSWSVDPLPTGVGALSHLACAGGAACVAVGSGPAGPVVVDGPASGTVQTWSLASLPAGIGTLSQVTCQGTTACLAIGTAAGGAVVVAGPASATGGTWVADILPSGTASLAQLTCRSGACLAIGRTSAGPLLVAGSASPGTSTWVADTLPTGVADLRQITCSGGPDPGACLAIATMSSGDAIIAGPASAAAQTWVTDTVPSGVTLLTQISCAPGGPACAAVGGDPSSGHAVIVSGSAISTPQTFSSATFPAGDTPSYFSGVGCLSGDSAVCVAAGATPTGAVLLQHSGTGPGSTLWTASHPSGIPGLVAAGLPVSVSNSEPPSTSFVACAAGTCGGAIGPLFPFASGYSVGAGNCLAELGSASTPVATVPGTTTATAPTVTLPLGLLPVQVVNPSGQPVSGATVTVTVADPNLPQDAPCNGLVSTLGTTGPDGRVGLAVIFETYTLSVNGAAVATVRVTPTSIVVNPAGASYSQPLPMPVVVTS